MKYSLIGSGNLAFSLSQALLDADYSPKYILSRNKKTAGALAKKFGYNFTEDYSLLKHSGLIFIAVNDDQIAAVARKIPKTAATLIHTSGSTDIDVLGKERNKTGVLYPVQTFRTSKISSFKNIPVCIEGNTPAVQKSIVAIASKLSEDVVVLDSAQRMHVHLAAVFVNNFCNHLLHLSFEYLQGHNIDPRILSQLLTTTFKNALKHPPSKFQTGPAARKDQKTMKKHLQLLKENPQLMKIYHTMSESIEALTHRNN